MPSTTLATNTVRSSSATHLSTVPGCLGSLRRPSSTPGATPCYEPRSAVLSETTPSSGASRGIVPFGPVGSGPSSRARCDAHGMMGKDYDDDFSEFGSIGRLRRRLPVAAKIAFVTAALTMAVGASPMPPGASAFLIKCVSTTGTSSIRIGR
jgi:hypothetical protein